jgi:hypothetical protein
VNPESLVRNLLWAGVARVIATRWNVDAETGVLLMDQFYDALLSGSDAPGRYNRRRGARENSATSRPVLAGGISEFRDPLVRAAKPRRRTKWERSGSSMIPRTFAYIDKEEDFQTRSSPAQTR